MNTPDGFYNLQGEKVPAEIVERDGEVTQGLELPGQGVLMIMVDGGVIGQLTFRATNKEAFMKVMDSMSNTIYKEIT